MKYEHNCHVIKIKRLVCGTRLIHTLFSFSRQYNIPFFLIKKTPAGLAPGTSAFFSSPYGAYTHIDQKKRSPASDKAVQYSIRTNCPNKMRIAPSARCFHPPNGHAYFCSWPHGHLSSKSWNKKFLAHQSRIFFCSEFENKQMIYINSVTADTITVATATHQAD
jgi:hypothetical protein